MRAYLPLRGVVGRFEQVLVALEEAVVVLAVAQEGGGHLFVRDQQRFERVERITCLQRILLQATCRLDQSCFCATTSSAMRSVSCMRLPRTASESDVRSTQLCR